MSTRSPGDIVALVLAPTCPIHCLELAMTDCQLDREGRVLAVMASPSESEALTPSHMHVLAGVCVCVWGGGGAAGRGGGHAACFARSKHAEQQQAVVINLHLGAS